MLARSILAHIVDDEALTRNLGDIEAKVLIEWLVDEAEVTNDVMADESLVEAEVVKLCRRCRAIAKFVYLWSLKNRPGAAAQLAVAERIDFPLPRGTMRADRLMSRMLQWESLRRLG
jgi:hypothetical protein